MPGVFCRAVTANRDENPPRKRCINDAIYLKGTLCMKKLLSLLCAAAMLLTPVLAQAGQAVTSFYPIYVFTLRLTEGIDDIDVRCLAAPGTGCLHDYQLSTADMKALSGASVFLINGAGMESYLDFVLDALPDLPVTDASEGVTLLSAGAEDDHDHGQWNAHIWLDAQNAMQMVRNLSAGLIAAFPEHAEAIAANRDAYLARLNQLDADLRAGLSTLSHKDIVTFHEAFPYFARAYGLNVAAVMNREPEDTLSPRQLAELTETIRSLGAPPLFCEPQYEDVAAQTLSRETGAPIYTLDPIVTGPATDIPPTFYEDRMLENMRVLQEALQ